MNKLGIFFMARLGKFFYYDFNYLQKIIAMLFTYSIYFVFKGCGPFY